MELTPEQLKKVQEETNQGLEEAHPDGPPLTPQECEELWKKSMGGVQENPRQWNDEEITDRFFKYLWDTIKYWSDPKLDVSVKSGETDAESRMTGFVHSLLTMFDGCAGAMPGFIVAPDPHPEDMEYCKGEGLNWYPQNHEREVEGDVRSSLNTTFGRAFYEYGRKHGYCK